MCAHQSLRTLEVQLSIPRSTSAPTVLDCSLLPADSLNSQHSVQETLWGVWWAWWPPFPGDANCCCCCCWWWCRLIKSSLCKKIEVVVKKQASMDFEGLSRMFLRNKSKCNVDASKKKVVDGRLDVIHCRVLFPLSRVLPVSFSQSAGSFIRASFSLVSVLSPSLPLSNTPRSILGLLIQTSEMKRETNRK